MPIAVSNMKRANTCGFIPFRAALTPLLHNPIAVSNMKNANTRDSLDKIRTTVLENLATMPPAPSAQMAPVPPQHDTVSWQLIDACWNNGSVWVVWKEGHGGVGHLPFSPSAAVNPLALLRVPFAGRAAGGRYGGAGGTSVAANAPCCSLTARSRPPS